jgi:hypothetical protein
MIEEYLTITELGSRLKMRTGENCKATGLYNPVDYVNHLKSLGIIRTVPELCPFESK